MSLLSIVANESVSSDPRSAPHPSTKEVIRNIVGPFAGFNAAKFADPDARAESAENAKKEIDNLLLKLELEEQLQSMLLPVLSPYGYVLARAGATHRQNNYKYFYTALRHDSQPELALAQLPTAVFARDDTSRLLFAANFAYMLKAFRGRRTRIFCADQGGLPSVLRMSMEDEARDSDWKFLPWDDVSSLAKQEIPFWQALQIAEPESPGISEKRVPGDPEFQQIIAVLVKEAGAKSALFFREMVETSAWPEKWKQDRRGGWKDNAGTDALEFVDFMNSKGVFPGGFKINDRSVGGESVLGTFLARWLDTEGVGGDSASVLAKILIDFGLVPDAERFRKLILHPK